MTSPSDKTPAEQDVEMVAQSIHDEMSRELVRRGMLVIPQKWADAAEETRSLYTVQARVVLRALAEAGRLRTSGAIEVCEKCLAWETEFGKPAWPCDVDPDCPLRREGAPAT